MSRRECQVLGYGGGRQTVAICLLIARGRLPRPDYAVIADTSWEAQSTWDYLGEYVGPFMEREVGLSIEVAPHSLATVDMHDSHGGPLMPLWTSGGQLQTFCSNEWKTRVARRYLRQTHEVTSATTWIGFALDETWRSGKPGESPWFNRYPLRELMLSRRDCEDLILAHGWPLPSKSACWMCPNRTNEEWRDLKAKHPQQFAKACSLDAELREDDVLMGHDGVWLHASRVPLAEADLDAADRKFAPRQCGLGAGCWT